MSAVAPGLPEIAREWGRIGCVGFGGPPAHVALLRELCVDRRGWLAAEDFEHGVAATNLLPGPASTQLAIYCAWRLRGIAGALVGGVAFIVPGLALIIALAMLFLGSPPTWIRGLGAGAGAVVAAVAVQAGVSLMPGSWERAHGAQRTRWVLYVLAGAVAGAGAGAWLVLVLLACGIVELAWRRVAADARLAAVAPWPLALAGAGATAGGLGALCWTAFKVGALSYGGGFVIVPLMQADAVDRHDWMSAGDFLNAVALGQATPGPVTQTVAVVGYAAHGLGGAILAAIVAFAPSFWFVALGARRFDRLRTDPNPRAFLDGAGPAAIGAIVGVAVPLAAALGEPWQYAVLAAGAVMLLVLRRGVVPTLLLAAAAGALAALAGAPLPS
ncbi:MAG TPA: chromate efflux transporter [Solirubrobacteraceae bacterium]|nr:chromate efflux transporter [Solirubrobacteraceae bacterium]